MPGSDPESEVVPEDDDEDRIPCDEREVLIERRVFEQALQREFIQGCGLTTLLSPALGLRASAFLSTNDMTTLLTNIQAANSDDPFVPEDLAVADIIPRVNFLRSTNFRLRDIILSRLREETRQRVSAQLTKVPAAILIISGFAGSGKTETVATVVLLCLLSPTMDRVMVYAQSNGATSNIAARIEKLNKIAIDTYNNKGRIKPLRYALVVRGHIFQIELSRILGIVATGQRRDTPRFAFGCSVAQWTLKLVGYGPYKLDPNDSEILFSLRRDFLNLEAYAGLRRFFSHEIEWDELVDEHIAKYGDECPNIAPRRLLKEIMTHIVMNANVVCTTPHVSRDGVYFIFNRDVATASVAEEAGIMTIPQLLLGWPRFRVLVLVGDILQLGPTCLGKFDKDALGNYLHSFALHAQLSALARFIGRSFNPGNGQIYFAVIAMPSCSFRYKGNKETWKHGGVSSLSMPLDMIGESPCSSTNSSFTQAQTKQAKGAQRPQPSGNDRSVCMSLTK
ncbi:hypothetical protein CONLIGDRAFT_637403 [Coniochaeta ligniaria NRRL 30616]|uniref:DNA2/NAM7 helicase helicase domain-containing protein n=1 Tax=Coniochaeta ligniaria NRRL 30616 TaxID=1408157 RepID=A0A1J7J7G4_9PEZI|nr:hypothetical protein CONLIGDRAFT_637403 [Coniochaeta ligniaria NRRL 30616]